MPTLHDEDVTSRRYTASPSGAGSRVEVVSMVDVTGMVFVVDDDVSVRKSLELLITSAGWQPLLFESAPEFLAYPRASAPSCLVLDVTLPGLNGLDLQKQLAGDLLVQQTCHDKRHDLAFAEGERRITVP